METTEVSYSPSKLLELAITNKADVGQLEKLMDLQERWEKNKARKMFLEAVSTFQSKCPPLKKKKTVDFENRTGGRTKYKYVPLGEITEAIKGLLHELGLSYRWEFDTKTVEVPSKDGSKSNKTEITCHCIISHLAGHSEKTSMNALQDDSGGKNLIQQSGSTMTYLQRYTLIGALGITTADEDNDGKTAQATAAPVEKPKENTNEIKPEELKQVQQELELLNTEKEIWDYAWAWPQYNKTNMVFKGLLQKRIMKLPAEAKMTDKEKSEYKRPKSKKESK